MVDGEAGVVQGGLVEWVCPSAVEVQLEVVAMEREWVQLDGIGFALLLGSDAMHAWWHHWWLVGGQNDGHCHAADKGGLVVGRGVS